MRGGVFQKQKAEVVEKLVELMRKYPVVAAADLSKVRSSQIHEMRRKLRGRVEMLVTKKTLTRKAAERMEEKKGLVDFLDRVKGPCILVFTDMDPFQLVMTLNKSKVKVEAKGGDMATEDIVVPAGNTGMPPGPIISEFGEAKIPTRIDGGSIWIASDTVVARKGEVISSKLASLLTRLGIKPMEAGLTLLAAYDRGLLLDRDALTIDLEAVAKTLRQAVSQAVSLSVNAAIPTKETTPLILARVFREALSLAVSSSYLTPETAPLILGKAQAQAQAIASKLKIEPA
ncbi:MAG: 50S ribosomal protein L10 [Candidatus Bathyarchaeia archaeon]